MEISDIDFEDQLYIEYGLELHYNPSIEEWIDKIVTYDEYMRDIPTDITKFGEEFEVRTMHRKAQRDEAKELEDIINSFGPQDVK